MSQTPSSSSPSTSSQRPAMCIECNQGAAWIDEDSPASIDEPVSAKLVAQPQSDGTVRVVEQCEPLLTCSPPRANAGLWMPLALLANDSDFDVQFCRGLRVIGLPEPVIAPSSEDTPINHHVIDFVRGVYQGVIRVGESVDKVTVIAQLARAYPNATFAIMTATRNKAKLVQLRLRREGLDVTRISSGWCPEFPGRIAVGTFDSFGHGEVELEKRALLIAYDAREALGERTQWPLHFAPDVRGRVIGLLRSTTKLSFLERHRLMATFGPLRVDVPENGFDSVEVHVAWKRYVGQRIGGRKASSILRRGIWRCEQRNRRLGGLAAALATGDRAALAQRFPHVARQLADTACRRVVVLVDTIDHAISLAKHLPAWPIHSPGPVCEAGLSVDQLAVLRRGRSRWMNDRCIATPIGLAATSPGTFDTFLWAGSGSHLPPVPDSHLMQPAGERRQILVVDVEDRHHGLLRRWSRHRAEAYDHAGWFRPGLDPAEGRTLVFLEECSEATT